MTQEQEHNHPEFPVLPEGGGLTCPAILDAEGTVCGEDMAFAYNVREYHPVRAWAADGLVLGEANDIDTAEEGDPHLWCAVGHDWTVPAGVEFE